MFRNVSRGKQRTGIDCRMKQEVVQGNARGLHKVVEMSTIALLLKSFTDVPLFPQTQ